MQRYKFSLTTTLKSLFELSLWLRKIWFVSDRWFIWLLASVSKPYLMDDLQHYLFFRSLSPVTQNCTIIMDLKADQNMSRLLMANSCGLCRISLNRCFALWEFLLLAFRASPGTYYEYLWNLMFCIFLYTSVDSSFMLMSIQGALFHLCLLTDDYILMSAW